MYRALAQLFAREARGLAEGDDAEDGFRAGAPLALLMAPDVLRDEAHAAPHEERARALRRVKLVGRHREKVTAEFFHIDRHSSCGLHGVRVQPQMTIPTGSLL